MPCTLCSSTHPTPTALESDTQSLNKRSKSSLDPGLDAEGFQLGYNEDSDPVLQISKGGQDSSDDNASDFEVSIELNDILGSSESGLTSLTSESTTEPTLTFEINVPDSTSIIAQVEQNAHISSSGPESLDTPVNNGSSEPVEEGMPSSIGLSPPTSTAVNTMAKHVYLGGSENAEPKPDASSDALAPGEVELPSDNQPTDGALAGPVELQGSNGEVQSAENGPGGVSATTADLPNEDQSSVDNFAAPVDLPGSDGAGEQTPENALAEPVNLANPDGTKENPGKDPGQITPGQVQLPSGEDSQENTLAGSADLGSPNEANEDTADNPGRILPGQVELEPGQQSPEEALAGNVDVENPDNADGRPAEDSGRILPGQVELPPGQQPPEEALAGNVDVENPDNADGRPAEDSGRILPGQVELPPGQRPPEDALAGDAELEDPNSAVEDPNQGSGQIIPGDVQLPPGEQPPDDVSSGDIDVDTPNEPGEGLPQAPDEISPDRVDLQPGEQTSPGNDPAEPAGLEEGANRLSPETVQLGLSERPLEEALAEDVELEDAESSADSRRPQEGDETPDTPDELSTLISGDRGEESSSENEDADRPVDPADLNLEEGDAASTDGDNGDSNSPSANGEPESDETNETNPEDLPSEEGTPEEGQTAEGEQDSEGEQGSEDEQSPEDAQSPGDDASGEAAGDETAEDEAGGQDGEGDSNAEGDREESGSEQAGNGETGEEGVDDGEAGDEEGGGDEAASEGAEGEPEATDEDASDEDGSGQGNDADGSAATPETLGGSESQTEDSSASPPVSLSDESPEAASGGGIAGAFTNPATKSSSIGILIGVIVGVLALIALGIFLWWFLRRRKRGQERQNGQGQGLPGDREPGGVVISSPKLRNTQDQIANYDPSAELIGNAGNNPFGPSQPSQLDNVLVNRASQLSATRKSFLDIYGGAKTPYPQNVVDGNGRPVTQQFLMPEANEFRDNDNLDPAAAADRERTLSVLSNLPPGVNPDEPAPFAASDDPFTDEKAEKFATQEDVEPYNAKRGEGYNSVYMANPFTDKSQEPQQGNDSRGNGATRDGPGGGAESITLAYTPGPNAGLGGGQRPLSGPGETVYNGVLDDYPGDPTVKGTKPSQPAGNASGAATDDVGNEGTVKSVQSWLSGVAQAHRDKMFGGN